MRVIYRPHRGSLDEAMALKREFESYADMVRYIIDDWDGYVLSVRDATDTPPHDDERIGWRNVKWLMGRSADVFVPGEPCEFVVGCYSTDWEGKEYD